MISIDELAARQLRDYDSRQPGLMFANPITLSVEDAYNLQEAVAALRQQRGDKQTGYKVGCTSPAIRTQIEIDHPVSGRLWESERHRSGCSLKLNDFCNPAIEGELAVELTRDLHGENLPDSEIESAVGWVFPVIELHNAVFRRDKPSAAELIANNAIHAGFVAGTTRTEFRQLNSARLSIEIDGTVVDGYEGADLTKTIIQSLRWLAAHLARDGRQLNTHETVLTGSLPKLIPVNGDTEIRVVTSHFGNVAAQFVAGG